MEDNVRIAKELARIARCIASAEDDDYDDDDDGLKEMTEEIAEENNVVAGDVCYNCAHYRSIYMGEDRGECRLLKCITFITDVCKNFRRKK